MQQSVVNVLQPKFEEQLFHSWSVGYRPNRGVKRALQIILWNIESGYNHIYDCDIKGFFDNIPHKKLLTVLKKYVSDRTVPNGICMEYALYVMRMTFCFLPNQKQISKKQPVSQKKS
ncbi:reverse transcriptase domain-containing protein [Peribacillus butanolivorans]|uniref:reverse transcriptase domain-containing protein n=1 Tax=Peribacillus butanolivorans TaxID=421767 RepID=UPI0034D96D07